MKLLAYVRKYIFYYKTCFLKFILYSFIFWIITIVTPYISGDYIDILVYGQAKNTIYLYSLIILVISILHIIISYLKDVTYTRLLNDVTFKLNMEIFNLLNRVPLNYFQSKDAVYLSQRISDDTNLLVDFCISNPILILSNSLSVLISLFILFTTSLQLLYFFEP